MYAKNCKEWKSNFSGFHSFATRTHLNFTSMLKLRSITGIYIIQVSVISVKYYDIHHPYILMKNHPHSKFKLILN